MIFSSIVVPLDGSTTSARSLGSATWLASRLGARVHVLSATPRELPAADELRRLHVPEERWSGVELHQALAYPADAILAAVEAYGAELLVMTARGSTSESESADLARLVGHVTQAVLARCRVPVLLLPAGCDTGWPWTNLVVPVSGGTESDQAVALAVRLADALELTVQIAHVAGAGTPAHYSDQLHYEYAGQLEELVARALPTLSTGQRRCIRGLSLCRGVVATELLEQVKHDGNVLVVGWHGHLGEGRAEILKPLLRALAVPVLLVRAEGRSHFRLKVGAELG
jgi:nucleotide-binding universal stress UspA family protein